MKYITLLSISLGISAISNAQIDFNPTDVATIVGNTKKARLTYQQLGEKRIYYLIYINEVSERKEGQKIAFEATEEDINQLHKLLKNAIKQSPETEKRIKIGEYKTSIITNMFTTGKALHIIFTSPDGDVTSMLLENKEIDKMFGKYIKAYDSTNFNTNNSSIYSSILFTS